MVAANVVFSTVCERLSSAFPKFKFLISLFSLLLRSGLSDSDMSPTKYGEPASPNACDMRIWNASAVDLLVGTTTYCVGGRKEKYE